MSNIIRLFAGIGFWEYSDQEIGWIVSWRTMIAISIQKINKKLCQREKQIFN